MCKPYSDFQTDIQKMLHILYQIIYNFCLKFKSYGCYIDKWPNYIAGGRESQKKTDWFVPLFQLMKKNICTTACHSKRKNISGLNILCLWSSRSKHFLNWNFSQKLFPFSISFWIVRLRLGRIRDNHNQKTFSDIQAWAVFHVNSNDKKLNPVQSIESVYPALVA